MIKNTLRLGFIFLVFSLINGCASFPQNEIAPVTDMPVISADKNKPSVYIDFKFFHGYPDDEKAVELPKARETFLPDLEKSLNDMNLFESVTFDEFKKGDVNYTIRLYCYNNGNVGGAAVMGFITGLTLGLIPSAATDNYDLKVEVLDRNNNIIKSYQNKDSVRTWIGLWFIPMMGNTPQEAVFATIDNQIHDAMKEILKNSKAVANSR